MKCKKCDSEIVEGASFCSECGERVVIDSSDSEATISEAPVVTQEPEEGFGVVKGIEIVGEAKPEEPVEAIKEDSAIVEESLDDTANLVVEAEAPVIAVAPVEDTPVVNAAPIVPIAPVVPIVPVVPAVAPTVSANPVATAAPAQNVPSQPTPAQIAAAKKAEEQAAKRAESAKRAEEAKKAKLEAKNQKKIDKKVKQQELINVCPPEYKPISTAAYFWLMLLNCIPVVNIFMIIILSFAPKNKNLKSFERAFLMWFLILLVIGIIASVFSYFFIQSAFESFMGGFEDILGAFI